MYVEDDPYESITVLKFTYILTDQEIIDLRLDIQEQFEEERDIIEENPILTDEEKKEQLDGLITEYIEFEIDFDEEMTSICIGEQCTAINTGLVATLDLETWLDKWSEDFLGELGNFLGKVLLVISGLIGSGIIAYIVIKVIVSTALKGTGTIAKGSFKFTKASGGYWAKKITDGIESFFRNISNGISTIFTRK